MSEKKGDKKFKEAKEQITISIFNWSKDYASAASTFDQAYKIYIEAGLHQKSIKTLNELIICNQKLIDAWAVAKNYEAILDIYLKYYPQKDYETLKQTATNCFVNYRMSQSLDNGLKMISKVTKFLIKRNQIKQGIQLLHQSYTISLEEENSFKRKQIFNLMIEVYIQNNIYEEAIKLYYENIKMKSGEECEQDALIIVILIIIQGELKRSENQMYELGNIVPTFLASDECEAADNLIKSYNNGETDKFKKQTTRAVITTIFPLIIIRKLREVIVPTKQNYEKASDEQKNEIMKNYY